MSAPDFKLLILARYCGEFQPADRSTANVFKTSQDILIDLRPIADFTTIEIAEYLACNGYTIDFEDSTPVWLMKSSANKQLAEH